MDRFKNEGGGGQETSTNENEEAQKRADRLARFGAIPNSSNVLNKPKRAALEFTLDEYKSKK